MAECPRPGDDAAPNRRTSSGASPVGEQRGAVMPVHNASFRSAAARRMAVGAAAVAATGLAVVLASAVPAAADAGLQPAVPAGYWTPGRIWSVVAGVTGLAGTVTGAVALARAAVRARAATVRLGGAAAVAGLTCAVIGAAVVAAAEGGPGTGYGIVGGFID